MMWAEALISSSLLILAISMSLNSNQPQAGRQYLDFSQYSELSDVASISIEKNLSTEECASIFMQNQNFCYSCAWLDSGSAPPSEAQISYSSQNCANGANQKTNSLAISHTAWRDGEAQTLVVSKFEK